MIHTGLISTLQKWGHLTSSLMNNCRNYFILYFYNFKTNDQGVAMILFLPKLFDELRCVQLNQIALSYSAKQALNFEGNDPHYGNSFGLARIPEYEKVLLALTPLIKQKTGWDNIVPENSYTRIYFNGSDLKKHKDRPGLDITLSVCTFSDINKPWPLCVEDESGKVHAIEINPGDGALILGTKYTHWRDQLMIDESQKVIQSFYHWKFA